MRLPALGVLAALLLAGCGGDGGGSGPAAILASSFDRSEKIESYEMTFTLSSTLGEPLSGHGRFRGTGDSSTFGGRAVFTTAGETVPMEMRLVHDNGYLRFLSPRHQKLLPAGKTWVRMDDDEDLAQRSLTPSQMIDMVRGEDDVTEVGRQTIRGVPTVHLQAPIDIEELAERAPDGPLADRIAASSELADRIHLVADVWVGEGDDRLMRIAIKMTADGETGSLTMEGDILREGVSLSDITVPSAAETTREAMVGGGEGL